MEFLEAAFFIFISFGAKRQEDAEQFEGLYSSVECDKVNRQMIVEYMRNCHHKNFSFFSRNSSCAVWQK